MTIARDGQLDLDEIKMYYELTCQSGGDLDLVMLVERSGTPLPCESTREFADGKPRMAIGGYFLAAGRPPAQQRQLRMSGLYVARRSDKTTASLCSLLHGNDLTLRVLIEAYKASGDKRTIERDPTFQLELDEARVGDMVLNTGGPWQVPSELVCFEYRSITIRSAPQTETGQTGARSECRFNLNVAA